jgi:DNA topoisomerase I
MDNEIMTLPAALRRKRKALRVAHRIRARSTRSNESPTRAGRVRAAHAVCPVRPLPVRSLRRPSPARARIDDDPVASARAARLHYVRDDEPGIRRKRCGAGFVYVDARGKRVTDPETVGRIRGLVIPPAWTDVWISPSPNGHLQATGRDAKNRKQYRYHTRWRVVRDETKFERMIAFGEALPTIRARLERDLALPGLTREKVLATVVRLLDLTLIRVGNEEYVRANDSYGLTTLREEHVEVNGTHMRFRFRGKAGKEHSIDLKDAKLAKIVRRCQEIPGHELFRYVDEKAKPCAVESSDVNEYLRSMTQQDFTAKDFRTWAGSVLALSVLCTSSPCSSEAQTKRTIVGAIRAVAERLGNTPAICRKCYVHPAVLESFRRGALRALATQKEEGPKVVTPRTEADLVLSRGELLIGRRLHEQEVRILELLREHAKRPRSPSRIGAA